MNVIIETDRLLLRTFTLDDASLIYHLNLDPEVVRYTLDPIIDIEQAKQILEQVILPQYTLDNHGRWAVLTKPGNDFIGWCGLKCRPERHEIDLGVSLNQSHMG
ncbi:MAG: GNAT family N-acetyltransferase [Chitinophagaceae bacterium]